MTPFERLMNTAIVKELAAQDANTINLTFYDFHPKYTENVTDAIDEVYGLNPFDADYATKVNQIMFELAGALGAKDEF